MDQFVIKIIEAQQMQFHSAKFDSHLPSHSISKAAENIQTP